MRAICRLTVIAALLPVGAGAVVDAADSTVARASVVAGADFGPRTSVIASTDVLRFHVTDGTQPASAILTFAAGARAASTSEVLLFVAASGPIEATGSMPGDVALYVSSRDGSEAVTAGERVAVARWTGGGLRSGRLQFELRGAPGTYSIPVKLHLIVP